MAVIKLILNHIKRTYTTTERFNGDAPAQRGPDSASTADGDADVVGHGRHCRSKWINCKPPLQSDVSQCNAVLARYGCTSSQDDIFNELIARLEAKLKCIGISTVQSNQARKYRRTRLSHCGALVDHKA